MPTLPFNGYYLTLGLLVACTADRDLRCGTVRREVDHDLAPTTAKDLLDPLEQAYYSGLMHPAEIERIRESVKKTKLLDPDGGPQATTRASTARRTTGSSCSTRRWVHRSPMPLGATLVVAGRPMRGHHG